MDETTGRRRLGFPIELLVVLANQSRAVIAQLISPKNPFRQKYDVIRVDEGQDFSKVMFNLLRSMLKPGSYLFVYDDPLQTLWRDYDSADRGLQNAHRYYLAPAYNQRNCRSSTESL
jgi:superfamily I DNA/RNA helicase